MSASDAIIVSYRDPVRATLKDLLKRKNVSNIVMSENVEGAVADLERFPKGILILDWSVGQPEISRILTANLGDHGLNPRQILMLADEINIVLVTTSVEFGVNQIAHDLNNKADLEAKIGNMIRAGSQRNDMKNEMLQVAKFKRNGRFAEAEKLLEGLLQKNPTNLNLIAELADCLIKQDKPKEARVLLEPIPESTPPNLRYLHVYGRCLMQLGDFSKAHEILEKANLYNPHHAERLIDLGNVLIQSDRFKDATAAFDHALQIDPQAKDAVVGKGQAMMLDGSVNEALEVLQGHVDVVELASVFNLAAVFCIRKERFEEGMNLYKTAIRAVGDRDKLLAKLHFNMGIGYCRKNDFGAARRQFELACQHDESFGKAKGNLKVIEGRLASQAANSAAQSTELTTPQVSSPQDNGLSKIDHDFDDFDSDDITEGLKDTIGW